MVTLNELLEKLVSAYFILQMTNLLKIVLSDLHNPIRISFLIIFKIPQR